MEGVPTVFTKCQGLLGNAMHAFVADGTIVIRAWYPPVFVRTGCGWGSSRGFSGRACMSFPDAGVGN
jgi:hypothetical protein